jgi:hypothetical protein
MKYGGLKALGNILASRKGVFGILAILVSYFLLLGRLPDDAPEELIAKMAEVFGLVVAAVSALFIGGTALEDGLKKKALPPTDETTSSSASESLNVPSK